MAEKSTKKAANKVPTGPKPDRVAIAGDWEKAVGKALAKEKPAKGWPKPKKQKD